MKSYNAKAIDFLKRNNIKLTISKADKTCLEIIGKDGIFGGTKDAKKHNKYRFTLTNRTTKKSYWSIFWDSVNNFENNLTPNEYDILSCMYIDHSENFQDFCSNYGYDELIENNHGRMVRNSKAYNTFKAVIKQDAGLQRVFSESQLEELHEIN